MRGVNGKKRIVEVGRVRLWGDFKIVVGSLNFILSVMGNYLMVLSKKIRDLICF